MFKRRSQCFGLSLIELMLAMLLTTIVVGLITAIYLASEKNHQLQNSLNQIQENARTVTQLLKENIQLTGYIGCARLTENFPIKNYQGIKITAENKIMSSGHELSIRMTSSHSVSLLGWSHDRSILYVSAKPELMAGRLALISNCYKAEIFAIEHVSAVNNTMQKIITKEPLSQEFSKFSEVSLLEFNTYYVHETARKNKKGEPILALYVRDINNRHTELVEGVESMQIGFDVMQNGELNSIPAEQAIDGSAILGVNIKLILSSIDGVLIKKPWFLHVALQELV